MHEWSHWVERQFPTMTAPEKKDPEPVEWCEKRGSRGEQCDWRKGHAIPCSWDRPAG